MRVLPVSLGAVLVELADLDETLALAASLRAAPPVGLIEAIPAARTLMLRFRPRETDAARLAQDLAARDLAATAPGRREGRLVEIPVRYDGEDLAEVAELTGMSVEEVIARHQASEFTVAFCGFAPGFAYLVGGDPALAPPRRRTPRTRIPAGAVALAGPFSGVYPQSSPGGWQIIGATQLAMWDAARDPPALLQPGFKVRFVAAGATPAAPAPPPPPAAAPPPAPLEAPCFEVAASPVPALFQDHGRPGLTGQGVSASGALDRGGFDAANRLVGNRANTPCLELAAGGFTFKSHARATVALAGAPCAVTVIDAEGGRREFESWRAFALEPGDLVRVGAPARGARSYLAARGGFAVAAVLGAAATDTLARLGPDPVVAGAVLPLGSSSGLVAVALDAAPAFALPAPGETVTLDIVLGPRTDWFTPAGLDALTGQDWEVTPRCDRVGMRLSAPRPVARKDAAELHSEATATGAIQIPHDGQPVLFLADHPLTGGYPVVGTVAEHHLDLAGQIPVGARIRFRPLGPFAPIDIPRPGPTRQETRDA
jgi:KipI family sensor histidine kinase inhibitor